MAEILDGMTTIHTWIRSQALFRAKPNVSVACLNKQNLKSDIPKDDDDEDVVIRLARILTSARILSDSIILLWSLMI